MPTLLVQLPGLPPVSHIIRDERAAQYTKEFAPIDDTHHSVDAA